MNYIANIDKRWIYLKVFTN